MKNVKLPTWLYTIFGVISRFYYRFKIWQVDARYAELDMDMQCTTMSYKEYKEDADDLSKQRDYWEQKLNGL